MRSGNTLRLLESCVGEQDVRIWNVGWRDASRILTQYRCHWALVLERFCEYHLDLQLKEHGIQQLIMVGLIAHTCLEATVRLAAEIGYGITLARDARRITRTRRCMPAHEVNITRYATAIVTTKEIVDFMSSAHALELGGQLGQGLLCAVESPICKLPCSEVSLNAKLICQST